MQFLIVKIQLAPSRSINSSYSINELGVKRKFNKRMNEEDTSS